MARLGRTLALVAALIMLAACSSGSIAGSAAPSPQTGSASPEPGATEPAGAPQPEPGGPEKPRPPETGGVSVDYPRGQAGEQGAKALGGGRYCARISYLSNGVSVPPE